MHGAHVHIVDIPVSMSVKWESIQSFHPLTSPVLLILVTMNLNWTECHWDRWGVCWVTERFCNEWERWKVRVKEE